MPNQDKTGPEGKGPKTGRGLGRCPSDTDNKEINNDAIGLGRRGQLGRFGNRRRRGNK